MKLNKPAMKILLLLFFSFMLVTIAVMSVLSMRTYNIFTSDLAKYPESYEQINEFRTDFDSMNQNVEEYFKSRDKESLSAYQQYSQRLFELCEIFDTKLRDDGSEEQALLIDALNDTYFSYISQLQPLIEQSSDKNALNEYNSKYSKNADYISGYTEKLLTQRYEEGTRFSEDQSHKAKIYQIIQMSLFSLYAVLIMISSYIVVFRLSKKSKNQKQNPAANTNANINQLNISSNFNSADYDFTTNTLKFDAFNKNIDNILPILSDYDECAYFIINVDDFQLINSTISYRGGNEVLKFVAETLFNIFGDYGLIGRIEKDEFVVFIAQIPNDEFVYQKASETCKTLNTRFNYKKTSHPISVSVGVSIIKHPTDPLEMQNNADKMLENVKKTGKDGYQIYKHD